MPWVLRGNLKGPQGPQGIQGPKGDPGDTGDTGPAGTAATVSVGTTTTGAPGTNAAVTQTGTPQARTFNFTIPRGATGAAGEASDLSIGTVTTVPTNGAATASITGSPPHQVLNLGIPRGDTGQDGDAGVLGGAKARLSTAQSIPNGQWTVLSRSTVDIIVAGTVSWSFSPSRLQCYVEQGGWWMIGASIGWAPSNSGRRIMAVETWTGTDPGVNNATRIIGVEQVASANSWTAQNGSTVAYLDANTNVRLYCYQSSGSALSTDLSAPTELWLTRIL